MQTWRATNPVERRRIVMHEGWLRSRSHSCATLHCWQASWALDCGLWIDPELRANSNVQHVAQQALGRVGILHRHRSELTARLCALFGENWAETIKPLPPEAITAQIEANLGGDKA